MDRVVTHVPVTHGPATADSNLFSMSNLLRQKKKRRSGNGSLAIAIVHVSVKDKEGGGL